jgi:hypothetical protein
VATTDERDEVIDLTRADAGGDDVAVVPGGNDSGGQGRGRWIWLGAGAALAIAIVVVLVATLGSGNSSSSVQTAGSPNAAPVVTAAPTQPDTIAPAKNSTDTTVAAPSHTPTTSVTHTTTAPVHQNASSPPAQDTPPVAKTPAPTAPPQPLGPSALTWDAPTTFVVDASHHTLTVTVKNQTNSPAYTPTPLSCLQYGDQVCGQSTQTLQPGAVVTEHYTLDPSQFTSTPTAVYVGGYYKVMISA